MSLLQFLLIIVIILFSFFGYDAYKRKQFNILHFFVFFLGIGVLSAFTLDNNLLNKFGRIFGVARGADVLVYLSIITLFYLTLSLINRYLRGSKKLTDLVRAVSLDKAEGKIVEKIETVLIMPAYNEGVAVIDIIQQILDAGYGLIFVDDGSKSKELYQKIIKKFKDKNIVIIRHIQNLGQGGALQTGAEYILQYLPKVKYVGHFDSDGQHRLQDLNNFLDAFKKDKNLDIVLGSRFLGSTINMPKNKKRTLKIGILFTWLVSGIKLTDTHNGYRLMKRETLNTLKITMNNMAHGSEIVDIVKQQKLKYTEVPVTIIYTEETISKGQKISNALKIAKNLIYKKLFFR